MGDLSSVVSPDINSNLKSSSNEIAEMMVKHKSSRPEKEGNKEKTNPIEGLEDRAKAVLKMDEMMEWDENIVE